MFVSHLGPASERKEVLRGLQSAAPFLHNELVRRLDLRRVPDFRFVFDPSIERGARLAEIIHTLEDEESGPEA